MVARPRVHIRVVPGRTEDTLRSIEALGSQHGSWVVALWVLADTVEKPVRGLLRVKGWHHAANPPTPDRASLVVVLEDRHEIGPTFLTDLWEKTQGSTARFGLFGDQQSFATRSWDSTEWVDGPVEEPPAEPVVEHEPVLPVERRLAAFLVPTTRRPDLIRFVLIHLERQVVPPGWDMEIVVVGESDDPGRAVVQQFPRARYIAIPSRQVTDKLNAGLKATTAELVLAADDDDLQPKNRLAAAIRAHETEADFSGSGTLWFYDPRHDELTRWVGPPGNHLVGTSLAVRATKAREIGGWPARARGKDQPMATALLKAGAVYRDLTAELAPNLVALQHGQNLWDRPRVADGQRGRRGSFEIEGFGPVSKNLTRFDDLTRASLSALARQRHEQAPSAAAPEPVVTETWVPPREPLTCTDAGPGQMAFVHGLQSLGFKTVGLAEARAALRLGRKVLFHGWGAKYAEMGAAHPGQVFTLWHSGWTGSDLLGEGAILAEALGAARQGKVVLLWLDDRDVPPAGAEVLRPVWSPKDMEALKTGTSKVPRRVAVGFHGPYPGAAKNSLASVAGCIGLGADLHILRGAVDGSRGTALQALLVGERFTVHPFMVRPQAVKLLESAEVLVHPSLTDTWPYLVMEAVYVGTPVVFSDAIAWAATLPSWAQDLCLVRPATSSRIVHEKVAHLLDHPGDRERLVRAQRAVLDELAPAHEAETRHLLKRAGFEVGVGERLPTAGRTSAHPPKTLTTKPKVLLLSDVRGWAFDVNLRDMAEYLKDEFDFDFWYVADEQPFPPSSSFDTVYVPYHRWKVVVNSVVPRNKALGSLRSWWFYPENPTPPGPAIFDLVNSFKAFHVVTQHNYDELRPKCSHVVYLTNPVNMRRIGTPTTIADRVVASWNGNARHRSPKQDDVKGFWSIVRPACDAAGVPLEYAEYHTRRKNPIEMPDFYRRANLALCASQYEGASNSVMEAMAAGQALVTTDAGNAREMQASQLKHYGDTGILVVDRAVEAFRDVLEQLKQDPRRVVRMGQINRMEIEARWSWSVWKDRYSAFLQRGLT